MQQKEYSFPYGEHFTEEMMFGMLVVVITVSLMAPLIKINECLPKYYYAFKKFTTRY